MQEHGWILHEDMKKDKQFHSIYMIVWRRGNYRNRNQISDYQDPQVEVGDLVHKDTY